MQKSKTRAKISLGAFCKSIFKWIKKLSSDGVNPGLKLKHLRMLKLFDFQLSHISSISFIARWFQKSPNPICIFLNIKRFLDELLFCYFNYKSFEISAIYSSYSDTIFSEKICSIRWFKHYIRSK